MLTPGERRGARWVVVLLLLGAATEAWQGRHGASPELPVEPETRSTAVASVDSGASPPPAGAAALDLNRAGESELDALPGIGPVLAARIVAERTRRGRFRAAEDLLAVPGIGPRLYERLRDRVRVGP
jgi:competence protein ComEA